MALRSPLPLGGGEFTSLLMELVIFTYTAIGFLSEKCGSYITLNNLKIFYERAVILGKSPK